MAFNHDGKYEHFTSKTFRPEGRSGKDTTKDEASPCSPPLDWKQMQGLRKPWESKGPEEGQSEQKDVLPWTVEDSDHEEKSESKRERKAEGDD